tara:strand:+ start:550 stop:1803 length:1254 start_codon:yes stop_codon:yes gene_type:complete
MQVGNELVRGQSNPADDLAALTRLGESADLEQLKKRLSRFNLFSILRTEYAEIRHSNILAWLLDPKGSHKLHTAFLIPWLSAVLTENANRVDRPECWFDPSSLDATQVRQVYVDREHKNIDLLVVIEFEDEKNWVLCIENKVDAPESEGQLERYYKFVERLWPNAERRLYAFLSRGAAAAGHPAYLNTTYEGVSKTLRDCLKFDIPSGPQFLLEQYYELLLEKFVIDEDARKLAAEIYETHGKAIDYIVANKPDHLSDLTRAVVLKMQARADSLGIEMDASSSSIVRFVPEVWIGDGNSGETAWRPGGPIILFELSFASDRVKLELVAAPPDEARAESIWDLAGKPPFQRPGSDRPGAYIKPFKRNSSIRIDEGRNGVERFSREVVEWVEQQLKTNECKTAIAAIGKLIVEFEDLSK